MYFCRGGGFLLICCANSVDPGALTLTPQANIAYNKAAWQSLPAAPWQVLTRPRLLSRCVKYSSHTVNLCKPIKHGDCDERKISSNWWDVRFIPPWVMFPGIFSSIKQKEFCSFWGNDSLSFFFYCSTRDKLMDSFSMSVTIFISKWELVEPRLNHGCCGIKRKTFPQTLNIQFKCWNSSRLHSDLWTTCFKKELSSLKVKNPDDWSLNLKIIIWYLEPVPSGCSLDEVQQTKSCAILETSLKAQTLVLGKVCCPTLKKSCYTHSVIIHRLN